MHEIENIRVEALGLRGMINLGEPDARAAAIQELTFRKLEHPPDHLGRHGINVAAFSSAQNVHCTPQPGTKC
jgi:hypothetical protein